MGEVEKLRAQLAAMTAERDALVGAASVVRNCTIDLRGAGYDCVDLDGDVRTGHYADGDKVMCCGPRVYLDGLHILGPVALDHIRAEAKAEGRKEGMREAEAIARDRYKVWTGAHGVECDVTACADISLAILAAAQKEAGK